MVSARTLPPLYSPHLMSTLPQIISHSVHFLCFRKVRIPQLLWSPLLLILSNKILFLPLPPWKKIWTCSFCSASQKLWTCSAAFRMRLNDLPYLVQHHWLLWNFMDICSPKPMLILFHSLPLHSVILDFKGNIFKLTVYFYCLHAFMHNYLFLDCSFFIVCWNQIYLALDLNLDTTSSPRMCLPILILWGNFSVFHNT